MAIEVNCANCGNLLERFPYQVEKSEKFFCSSTCHGEFQKQLPPEEHGSYNGGKVSVDCAYCGERNVKRVWPNRLSQNRFFCNQECMGSFRERQYSGESNPNYKGGDWEHNYRGPDWAVVRNSVRERDNYTCQSCGTHRDDLGQIPDCHHIQPEHTFDERNDAHYSENLVLLCRDCHNTFDNLSKEEQNERLK